ncbi:MAG: hypothetical protein Kow0037_23480 [Calditrichia bacterium]
MKVKRRVILITIILLGMLWAQNGPEPVGKITFPLNRVFVLRAGTDRLMTAHFNMDVFPGDKIETKKESRCEITLKNGSVVRIDENSIYTLEQVKIKDEHIKAESSLSLGKLWATIRKLVSSDDYVKVKSPSAVIAVRGTIYRVNVAPDSTTQVRVYEGAVAVNPALASAPAAQPETRPNWPPKDVEGPQDVQGPRDVSVEEWLEIVKAQQQIVVRKDGSYQKSDFNMEDDAQSDWVQWNLKRDAALNR